MTLCFLVVLVFVIAFIEVKESVWIDLIIYTRLEVSQTTVLGRTSRWKYPADSKYQGAPGRESSEEEPNWKNLREDIEWKDRDFRARRTFVSTGKNIFPSPNVDLPRSDADVDAGAHVPCNSYSASLGKQEERNTFGFHSPSFRHLFPPSLPPQCSSRNRNPISFRNESVVALTIKKTLVQICA